MQTVAIVGASSNPQRYANKAQKMLVQYGHRVVPVSVKENEILGEKTVASVAEITEPVATVTLYIGPQYQAGVIEQLKQLKPQRVIFNPGTENPAAYAELNAVGIETEEACTLVLLSTDQFE